MTLKRLKKRIKPSRLISNHISPMKENIQKLAKDFATAVQMLKEEKLPEATEALEAISDTVAALETEATAADEALAAKDAEIVEKSTEIQKNAEAIAKYASLNISVDSMASLVDDMKVIKDMMGGNAEVMKSVSTKEDMTAIEKRLETIEKAGESRQLQEGKRESMAKSAIAGLDLSPAK